MNYLVLRKKLQIMEYRPNYFSDLNSCFSPCINIDNRKSIPEETCF